MPLVASLKKTYCEPLLTMPAGLVPVAIWSPPNTDALQLRAVLPPTRDRFTAAVRGEDPGSDGWTTTDVEARAVPDAFFAVRTNVYVTADPSTLEGTVTVLVFGGIDRTGVELIEYVVAFDVTTVNDTGPPFAGSVEVEAENDVMVGGGGFAATVTPNPADTWPP